MLNKLDNFIKNAEGRILYVSPSDLDSTDAITNTGNSLAQPFKTIQRALLEAARFSFLQGKNNDLVERTTILLFPGEHVVDNRPGYAIYNNTSNGSNRAYAVPPTGGIGTPAAGVLSLELDSNFDLTQEDNILYKFNSVYGGVIIPRGTSIVGLDLRKTKIRPKYVPNPTDPAVKNSAIFRTTGACYFWQFSIFDGDETGTVYTHPSFFTSNYKSKPSFSHHKLSCFEYADGVNNFGSYGLTDLDMYYSKLSNAYNSYREIPQDSKFPASSLDFAKRDPEWQIVGAFASDPVEIQSLYSGNGTTADLRVTVTTKTPHNLNAGTPIKIRGVGANEYNISSFVQSVLSETQFSYLLESFPINLPVNPSASGATVTVETDTVSGASPYIFNCSLRSVWGMNGLHADGAKASGFRSMVVAQFTAISLQKDDRAFVKYDQQTRTYNGVNYSTVYGSALPTEASQTDIGKAYHLDPDAIYRQGWESSHLKISNDGFIQIVSVFAIGFNKHFDLQSGADASITNSNSNFGQISLSSDGFKASAFDKDNKAYITSIIPPRDINLVEENIEWLSIDVGLTTSVGVSTHLYLYGLTSPDSPPISITQGYRIGARVNDKLYLSLNGTEYSANIYMEDGLTSSFKKYEVSSVTNSVLTIGNHRISTGEKVIINSETGDLPENVIPHTVYYAIRVSSTEIRLASSFTNALNGEFLTIYGGTQLVVYSRVSDKNSGEIGSPIQFDSINNNWFIITNSGNQIYNQIASLGVAGLTETTDLCYIKRIIDDRSLDEKIYKLRVVIPKEFTGAKDPQNGFIIQESSTTGAGSTDFTRSFITASDYNYKRNQRFITTCTVSSNTVTTLTELPHNLNINDIVIIRNVIDDSNLTGTYNVGYNGKFRVTAVVDNMTFQYSTTDIDGIVHAPTSSSKNNINNRTTEAQVKALPRFERSDLQSNLYVYRNEVISPYIAGTKDGVYHIYTLNASNRITEEFTNLSYSQSSVDLYPQLDRDNIEANPPAAKTFALRAPIGDVNTNDLKKSITRETVDKALVSLGIGLTISSVSSSTLTFSRNHNFNGITSGTLNTINANYTPGTYYNVKLLNGESNPLVGTWKGATAKVSIASGGNVTSIDVIAPGSGYANGDVLYLDSSRVGSGINATYTIQTSNISSAIGEVVQITGIGTTSSEYFRISSVDSKNQISIAKTTGDATPIIGQYVFHVGPSIIISNITAHDATTGISTFTCASSHGLLSGNKFKVTDSSNNNLGDYIVKERTSLTVFTAITNKTLSATGGYILKHGLSANQAISDIREENIGSRQVTIYDREIVSLNANISNDSSATVLSVSLLNSQTGLNARFPMGSYIQIDNEIMRITSSNNTTQFTVIRGSLGTKKEPHVAGSLIRKIKPIPIEFRRPSTLRASGHTFEYLGYGPGNYSTALPQVQVQSLSEREEFLVQSQERSGGIVVYTGMNNNGDFFSGNTKTSSVSGEVISYDIPKPTVTGEDPSKSSVVYDEVTVKERLFVEGGDSGTILSQFDGPVTFNKQIRAKGSVTLSGLLRSLNTTTSDSPGKGAFTIRGGVGIGENLNVGGTTNLLGSVLVSNTTDSTSITTGALRVLGGVGISKKLTTNSLRVDGSISVGSTVVVSGAEGITSPKFKSTTPDSSSLNGTLTYKMLRSDGTQDFITSREVSNALGYVPANIAAISGDFPIGNSLICDDISEQFNGSTTEFTLKIAGNIFIPAGSSANLLVSLNNVIKRPGTDFFIVTVGGLNTSTIKFTTPPSANSSCFIVAFGGLGSLLANVDWTAKGQIIAGKGNKAAASIPLGSNGQVLTVDNLMETGIKWATAVPTGSVFYMAGNSQYVENVTAYATIPNVGVYYAPEGYLICNGDVIPEGGVCQGLASNKLQTLRSLLGTIYGNGTEYRLPNLINRFAGYGPLGEALGNKDAIVPYHTHTATDSGHNHQAAWFNAVGAGGNTFSVANGTNVLNTGIGYANITVAPAGEPNNQVNANLPPYLGMIPVIKY
jgi:microcystin-dependent protein